MHRLLALCALLICCSLAAAAQEQSLGPAPSLASSAVSASGYPAGSPNEQYAWQVAVTYEFLRVRPTTGQGFNMNGFNTSVVRFVNSWFGLEGDVAALFGTIPATVTFGTLPPNQKLDVKAVFAGGGPRLVHRTGGRIEPWVHGLVGGTHLRFPQTSTGATANAVGFVVGGGIDWRANSRMAWRVQGDYFGTRFFDVSQHNFQFKTGIVFNF